MNWSEEPTPLEQAKCATRKDSAGHWPTVAGILLEEVERLEKQVINKPTHLISATTYANGETDFTWDDIETKEHFGVTIKLTNEQCKQLGKVVPSCIHLYAVLPNSK